MNRRTQVVGAAALVVAVAAAAGTGVARGSGGVPEDDLAVVKRAVAQSTQLVPREPATAPAESEPPRAAARPPRTSGKEPTWLKVRVTEKGTGRKKVTVNLPLALVRVLDDGSPIDFACGGARHRRCAVRIAEILETLEAGQDIVEIDDEEALVRVWVE